MKVNRYTRLTPSRFTPRSVEEIMMVPLAKQQQHNHAEQQLSKLDEFDFNRLPGDEKASAEELSAYREKINTAVDQLAATGVSNTNRASIVDLNRQLRKDTAASGKWGKRMANYKAYKAWSEEVKKERGKWSMREAQTFIGKGIEGFKTDNENGTSNAFSGRYLPNKRNVQESISVLLDRTSEETLQSLGIFYKKKLEFADIYTDREIIGKSMPKLFKYLKDSMLADKELTESVSMQNYLSANPEKDPFNPGKMVKDPFTGEEKYVPGSALFAQIYNAAEGEAYTKVKDDNFTIKNETAIARMKERLKSQFGNSGMVNIEATILESITPEVFDKVNYEIKNLDNVIKESSDKLNTIVDKTSYEYKHLKQTIERDTRELSNLKVRIEDAEARGISRLTPEERNIYNISEEYDALTEEEKADITKEEFFKGKGVKTETFDSYNFGTVESNVDPYSGTALTAKEMYGGTKESTITDNIPQSNEEVYSGINKKINSIKKTINNNARDIIEEDIKSNRGATTANIIYSDSKEPYSKVVNQVLNTMEGDKFDPQMYTSVKTGNTLDIDFEGQFTNAAKPSSAGENEFIMSKTKVGVLNSRTFNGNPQFAVVFERSNGTRTAPIIVTMGINGQNKLDAISDDMINSSDRVTAENGWLMKFGDMAKVVSSSGMRTARSSEDRLLSDFKFNGNENVTYSKWYTDNGQERFTVNLRGKKDTKSKVLESTREVEKYLYLAEKMTSINLREVTREQYQNMFESIFETEEVMKYAADE